jgi:hypothetical protein
MKMLSPAFRWLAVLVLITTVGLWWRAGASRGWTKHSVAIEKKDEITEIVYTEYEKRWVPGVDFLVGGLIASAGLGLIGWWLGRRRAS